jgi:hypothetical protein
MSIINYSVCASYAAFKRRWALESYWGVKILLQRHMNIWFRDRDRERERERRLRKKNCQKKRFATTGVLEQAPIIVHCTRSQANVCLSSYSFGDGSYWGTLILQRTYQMLAWSAWSRFRSPAVLRSFFFPCSLLAESGETGKRSQYGDLLRAGRFDVRTQVGAREFPLSTPF